MMKCKSCEKVLRANEDCYSPYCSVCETQLIKEVQEFGRFLVDFDQDDDWDSVAVKFSELSHKLHISSLFRAGQKTKIS